MALVPWPPRPVDPDDPDAEDTLQWEAAIAQLRRDALPGAVDEQVVRWGTTASALIVRWLAPTPTSDVPDEILNESAVRLTGWLLGQPAKVTQGVKLAGVEMQEFVAPAITLNGIRFSGAGALLGMWKRREAG